jgi:hypothetical protein
VNSSAKSRLSLGLTPRVVALGTEITGSPPAGPADLCGPPNTRRWRPHLASRLVRCLSPQRREMPRPGTTRLCPAESHGPSREWIAAGRPPPVPPARPLSETGRSPSRPARLEPRVAGDSPPSAPPPARLSQDSNILSRNLTDGAGHLHYIADERMDDIRTRFAVHVMLRDAA